MVALQDPSTVAFKLGFHAVPSMAQLHLHVVSQVGCTAAPGQRCDGNSVCCCRTGRTGRRSADHAGLLSLACHQDFDSPSLKNKKHWNSFTSAFFLPIAAVEEQLARRGSVELMSPEEERRLLALDLRCHGCGAPHKSMPKLKQHIVECSAVRALDGL